MMNWTFYIDNILIDEPQGFSEVVLDVKRDEVWHGIFFEATTTKLKFYGTGAALLMAKKQSDGLAASAVFKAVLECGETKDFLETNFDFGSYTESCGNTCFVQISLENKGSLMVMRNRYEQPVNLNKNKSFAGVLLPNYNRLNFDIEFIGQEIYLINRAIMDVSDMTELISSDLNWTPDPFGDFTGYLSPALPTTENASFGVFTTSSFINLGPNLVGASNQPPYPDFPTTVGLAQLFESNNICQINSSNVSFRMKGEANINLNFGVNHYLILNLVLFILPAGLDGTVSSNWTLLYNNSLVSASATGVYPFDLVTSFAIDLEQGDFLYYGVYVNTPSFYEINSFSLTQNPECFFELTGGGICAPSLCSVSMINESGARIIEAITDNVMTLKSDYFGRTDSQPYTSSVTGCGGMRVITNGLKLRAAAVNNHFISLKQFFTGLTGIDNIGIGIEPNPNIPNAEWVRVEPVEYFYQNVLLLSFPFVPNAELSFIPDIAYSTIHVGYDKWEVENFNGLNEFNSNKKFRTSLSTIKNELLITSNFVASGTAIEVTRNKSFSITGAADTTYDNETFIVCVGNFGIYYVKFDALLNNMVFKTQGAGAEFLIANITITGSLNNDGTRAILSTSITALGGDISLINITFNGGVTVDEIASNVTFGIVSTGIFVEKQNINNSSNVYSPLTSFNWRIRPLYNLMRWFKSIVNVYINLSSTTSKLYFASGTGNYIAAGELDTYDSCRLEAGPYAENINLSINHFADTDYLPIYHPEIIKFKYPLSLADYNIIKANPYGIIKVQCGQGDYEECYIQQISYTPSSGVAQFNLIKKWQ